MTTPSPSVQVTGLLVLDDGSTNFANIRDVRHAGTIYIRCAALLAKSVIAAGHRPVIVTNRAEPLARAFVALGVPDGTAFVERAFQSKLERGAMHRAAHHKLDIIRDLADLPGDDPAMIVDLDAVFLRPLGPGDLPARGAIGCYDITPDMGRESDGRSTGDLHAILGEIACDPRWYGGEAIIARPWDYRALVALLDEVEPRYWALRPMLYHSGDEAPVSAALNLLTRRGGRLHDLGIANTIVRWWTAKRPFPQPRLTELTDRAILHLPADKEFLASQAHLPFAAATFLARYRAHARTKLALRQVESTIRHHALRQPRAFVARV